jgi:hypothetical protein
MLGEPKAGEIVKGQISTRDHVILSYVAVFVDRLRIFIIAGFEKAVSEAKRTYRIS